MVFIFSLHILKNGDSVVNVKLFNVLEVEMIEINRG